METASVDNYSRGKAGREEQDGTFYIFYGLETLFQNAYIPIQQRGGCEADREERMGISWEGGFTSVTGGGKGEKMGVKQNCLQNLPLSSVSYNPGVSLNGSGRGVRSRSLIPNCAFGGRILFQRMHWSGHEGSGCFMNHRHRSQGDHIGQVSEKGYSLEHLMRTLL